MSRLLLVKCPKCGNEQKMRVYKDINKSTKLCVYCGRRFKVHTSPYKTTIVREIS